MFSFYKHEWAWGVHDCEYECCVVFNSISAALGWPSYKHSCSHTHTHTHTHTHMYIHTHLPHSHIPYPWHGGGAYPWHGGGLTFGMGGGLPLAWGGLTFGMGGGGLPLAWGGGLTFGMGGGRGEWPIFWPHAHTYNVQCTMYNRYTSCFLSVYFVLISLQS